MIEILEESAGKVVGMRVSGKLLHHDYEQFVPLLEKAIADHGSIRCLMELTELQGIEPRAIWDELKFDFQHALQIERCAVVGDKRWESWMTKLSRPVFARAEVRFFDRADVKEAWNWIYEGLLQERPVAAPA